MFAVEGRRGLARAEGCREGLEVAVALVEEGRAVVVVGSGFGNDVDDAVAGAANFRGEAGGGNLKLADGVLGEIGEGSADDFVVVVAAVDGDIAAAAKAAGRADLMGVVLGGIEGGRGTIAGNEIGEFKEVAAVEGDVLNGVLSDLALEHGLRKIHS